MSEVAPEQTRCIEIVDFVHVSGKWMEFWWLKGAPTELGENTTPPLPPLPYDYCSKSYKFLNAYEDGLSFDDRLNHGVRGVIVELERRGSSWEIVAVIGRAPLSDHGPPFNPQPGDIVRWKSNAATVREVRGCSTYVIDVGAREHVVDYVELSPLRRSGDAAPAPKCQMVTGFKATPSGEPGEEVYCSRSAVALSIDVPICTVCLASMVLHDHELARDLRPLLSPDESHDPQADAEAL